MEESKSREKILKKVRAALIQGVVETQPDIDLESEIYVIPPDPLEEIFAKKLLQLNGKFVFCESAAEFPAAFAAVVNENNWDRLFSKEEFILKMLRDSGLPVSDKDEDFIDMNVGLTSCECLIARTGTVLVSSRQVSGRRLPVYPHYHIVVAFTDQLVMNIRDGLKMIKERYRDNFPSMISAITGPSRTADIEKTLVQGAHGPKEIYVFLIDRP